MRQMVRYPLAVLLTLALSVQMVAGDWNILHTSKRENANISLKNYCESWRINVELHNLRDFDVVPQECVQYIGKYMTSTQYVVDIERAAEQVILFLANNFVLDTDGKDAWIFDIDDTLLSTVPYHKKHQFGGEKLNATLLAKWMQTGKAPALEPSLSLYNHIKNLGLKIFLVSTRDECLRDATVANLLNVGYTGWTSLILRGVQDDHKTGEKYNAEQRKKMVTDGYRVWGVVRNQWSSLLGQTSGIRTFKLPNPMYYQA